MSGRIVAVIVVGVLCALDVSQAPAQQIGISTPFTSVQDDFFERIGVGFGFQLQGGNPNGSGSRVVGLLPGGQINPSGNIVFGQGGFNSAIPPFGGHDPNADAQFGVGLLKGGNGLFFNVAAGQGNTRSIINQTPTVVIPNGGTGAISDTSQTPFVTSIIPVIGDAFIPPFYPTMAPAVHPLRERLERLREQQRQHGATSTQRAAAAAQALGNANLSREDKLSLQAEASRGSSAGHGDLSVAEIKNRQSAEELAKQAEVQSLVARAKGAEELGKSNVAKIYYRQALARATGDVRDEIQSRLQSLGK